MAIPTSELIKASPTVATIILDLQDSISKSRHVFTTVPVVITEWIADDEARKLLRKGDFVSAFQHASKPDSLSATQSNDVLSRLATGQAQFAEQAVQAILDNLTGDPLQQAIERFVRFCSDFETHSKAYHNRVRIPMGHFLSLAKLDDKVEDALQCINQEKRAEVFKAFMYHPNSKFGLELVKRAEAHLKVSRNARKASADFALAQEWSEQTEASVCALEAVSLDDRTSRIKHTEELLDNVTKATCGVIDNICLVKG